MGAVASILSSLLVAQLHQHRFSPSQVPDLRRSDHYFLPHLRLQLHWGPWAQKNNKKSKRLKKNIILRLALEKGVHPVHLDQNMRTQQLLLLGKSKAHSTWCSCFCWAMQHIITIGEMFDSLEYLLIQLTLTYLHYCIVMYSYFFIHWKMMVEMSQLHGIISLQEAQRRALCWAWRIRRAFWLDFSSCILLKCCMLCFKSLDYHTCSYVFVFS